MEFETPYDVTDRLAFEDAVSSALPDTQTVRLYSTAESPPDSDALDLTLSDDEVLVHCANPRRGEGRYVAVSRTTVERLVKNGILG
jgi:hypothetical protein